MRTIRQRYWQSLQYPGTIDQKSKSSFPASTESWAQTQHSQMPFWSTRSRLPWTNNNNHWGGPSKTKDCQIPQKVRFPRPKKAFQRFIGFLNYDRNYIPRLAERLTPFFQLLKKTDAKTKIPNILDIMKEFGEINEALDRCCQLALRQPLPGKQLVLMTDASFQAAGYAVLIEDDPNQKYTSTRKTYAPIAYGSKTFSPSQIKMPIYAKEFLAIYMAFKEFGHVFWGATKPVIIMTDSKSVTRFFQTKMIPPPLRNACDFVLQFNFTIAHIPGKMNTAADLLSRLEVDPKEKII